MIESWFVPLDVRLPVRPEHLHAALSRWFDVGTDDLPDRHRDLTKPYTISPPTDHDGRLGVMVSTLTDEAAWRLRTATASHRAVRLGRQQVRVGRPVRVESTSWAALSRLRPRFSWVVEFLTPTTFRSGQRASPFPAPAAMLRGPSVCWDAFSGLPPRLGDRHHVRDLWVSDVDLQTVRLELRGISWPAALGHVEVRADDPAAAAAVTPLFALAPYCGVGSFRGKGFGVVRVRPAG